MTVNLTESWNVDLQFRSAHGRSFLGRQYVAYPYHVTRVLYDDVEEKSIPKLILQSLSGGIYEGDHLRHRFELRPSARADIRTQGSTIVQNARDGRASSTTIATVACESSMLYIPEPQILFSGADFVNTVSVHGVESAKHVVIADSFLAYDPEVGPSEIEFQFIMTNKFMNSDGNTLAIDKSIIEGASHQRSMNGYKGYASFMFHGEDFNEQFLAECCNQIENLEAEAAYSSLPTGAGYIIKTLAMDGAVLSQILELVRAQCIETMASYDHQPEILRQTESAPLDVETTPNRAAGES